MSQIQPDYEKLVNHIVSNFKAEKSPSHGINSVLFSVADDREHDDKFFKQIAQRFEAPVLYLDGFEDSLAYRHSGLNDDNFLITKVQSFVSDNPHGVLVLSNLDKTSKREQAFFMEVMESGQFEGQDFKHTAILAYVNQEKLKNNNQYHEGLSVALISRFSFPVTLDSSALKDALELKTTPKSATIINIDSIRKDATHVDNDNNNNNKPKL